MAMLVDGLPRSRNPLNQEMEKVLMVMIYLVVLHHSGIQKSRCLDVSTIKEIANSELLAVANYTHAGFAMTKSVTTPWIGNLSVDRSLGTWLASLYTLILI